MAALPADLAKIDPADAWKPWSPSADEPWNRKWIAHLYRRAAFGATPAEIDLALKDGFPKTLEHLRTGEADAADRLEVLTESGQFYTEPSNLRMWWLYAMIEGGHPLREKLTLFWHNHFATSFTKVLSTKLMYEQNIVLRKHALGRFRPFLLDMSKDTAMLVWLDSNRNVKGVPNENYAREVMELFSLGVGNYTEKDVQEAARAFTGWHHDAEVTKFENVAVLHDDGEKTILGKTGKWSGEDVVRICCDQPACAKFLVGKLYSYIVSETPPPKGLLTPLEERFRKSDYDIAALVGDMLASRLFFSEHAYRKRVKWPVEYVVESVRTAVPGRVPLSGLVDAAGKMGQTLFAPPNVKGWRTGTDWLNSATLLARNNFSETVALGKWSRFNDRIPDRAVFATPSDFPVGAAAMEPPPLPPAAEQDPVAIIYAANPKDIPAIVKRMGEVLHGEPVPAAVAAKLEKFLREPPEPSRVPVGGQPQGTTGFSGTSIGSAPIVTKAASPKKVETLPVAPPPRLAQQKPYKPEIGSVEFKARVREALHAMMCLPEYQLN